MSLLAGILTIGAFVAGDASVGLIAAAARYFDPARRAARYAKWLTDNVPHKEGPETHAANVAATQAVMRNED